MNSVKFKYRLWTLGLTISTSLICLLAAPAQAKAAADHGSQQTQCKMQFNDIGTIIGRGKTQEAALEDAATKCFDLRAKAYRQKNGVSPGDDPGLLYIDTCVNTRCA